MARIFASIKGMNSKKMPMVTQRPRKKGFETSKPVSEILLDCIRTGELDAFREALALHIVSSNKSQLSKRTGIGRRTLYDILDPKINFNPELSTVSAIIRGLAE